MEKLTIEEKVIKAKAGLILESPFFASIIRKLAIKEDGTAKTIWTDGISLGYNPAFIQSVTLDQLKGSLCHEALHIVLKHHMRRQEREPSTWNKAGDYAINPIVENAGFKLPEQRLFNSQFVNQEAENIYSEIYHAPSPAPTPNQQPQGNQGDPQEDPQKDPRGDEVKSQETQGNPDPGQCGEVRDLPIKNEIDKAQHEQDLNITIQQAINIAKSHGQMPAELERIITEILSPNLPWQEILARFLDQNARNDYTWTTPNKKYLTHGLYLPALKNSEIGQIVFIGDSSGSITEAEMKRTLGEAQGILTAYDNTELTILFVNNRIQGEPITITKYDSLENIGFQPGGGTCYKPGFKWIEENGIDPKAIIYFTDGECNSFPEREPEAPVLWILTHKPRCYPWSPPFGETIIMKQKTPNNE